MIVFPYPLASIGFAARPFFLLDGGLYYWDTYGAKEGDKIDFKVTFSNVNNKEMPPFKDTFVVKKED